MSIPVALFVLLAVLLMALLLWASRPPQRRTIHADDLFELLSQPKHCIRAKFILQALKPEDIAYLKERGATGVMRQLRQDRRRIALSYLDCLQDEFETLLEMSRVIAVTAPELAPEQELARWKVSLTFAAKCTVMRWRFRLGLQPAKGFDLLSAMATDIARHLEAATNRIAESVTGSSPIDSGAPYDAQGD
jgi:hypothetical protein